MENNTQTTPTTPSAPAPATTPPVSPTVNEATGRHDVMSDVFLTEEEQEIEKKGATPSEETPPTGEQPETPPATPEPPKTETPPATPQDKTYAGKYKTVEELKAAFVELGGNPEAYSTPEAMEQAYEVRQREFTRVRQEQAEIDRLNNAVPEPQAPTLDENGINELLAQVPWEQVKDAKDLATHLLGVMVKNLPKLMPQQKQLTEAELAAKVAPMVAERERKLKELGDIEGKVPRLKTDQNFRKAFAQFVQGQKSDASYKSLDESMKDFLGLSQSIVDELGKTYQQNQVAKASAATPPEGGEAPHSTGGDNPKHDEVDDIIGAYQDHKGKFEGAFAS